MSAEKRAVRDAKTSQRKMEMLGEFIRTQDDARELIDLVGLTVKTKKGTRRNWEAIRQNVRLNDAISARSRQ